MCSQRQIRVPSRRAKMAHSVSLMMTVDSPVIAHLVSMAAGVRHVSIMHTWFLCQALTYCQLIVNSNSVSNINQ